MRIMRPLACALTLFLIAVASGTTQGKYSALSIQLAPGGEFPVGGSTAHFTTGASGVLTVAYKPPIAFPISIGVDLGYGLLPFNLAAPLNLNLLAAGAGPGVDIRFLDRLSLSLYARAGYYFGLTRDESGTPVSGGNPFVWAGGQVSFLINPRLSIGVGAAYRSYLGLPEPLANTVGVFLATQYRFPLGAAEDFAPLQAKPALLKLTEVRTEGIFPVFYQHYDDHPIGKALLHNQEKAPVSALKVSVFIRSYMDSPKTFDVPGTLAPGEKKEIDLYALFTEKVLDITEGTKAAAEIVLEYRAGSESKRSENVATVKLENRNASIWDDNRRAAAFVTARDPAVLKFAKSVASVVRTGENQVVDYHLRVAIGMNQALSLFGLGYVPDPKTPYIEFVKNAQAVDFLQFPRQTLDYKAGDCDDLSILFSALLESVSIETAFVTVPDHIYIAFALDTDPAVAAKIFGQSRGFIVRDGRAWLPLEVTLVRQGFLAAWEEGAREWKEFSASGKAGFYPLADAWSVFAPVGLPGEAKIDTAPDAQIAQAYRSELSRVVEKEVGEREKDLQARIRESKDSPRLANSLGTLYARFGLFAKAEEQFRKILAKQEYVPALLNLGNVAYLKNDPSRALELYTRAYRQDPDNPNVLLGLLQVYREGKNRVKLDETYARLARISPETAQKHESLVRTTDEGTRAGDARDREVLAWED